ncbi:uncharacterized protein LOC126367171 [Pectinophora gossypiella]|uniref:uncharacterized protein LOC126367171 n=1 Tax=Pectinophora gossypiella TaxID=13191 RepID=UPI00214E0598|nr:uncharacterized protein LOC126367171 [Pectinophora gossypiella]
MDDQNTSLEPMDVDRSANSSVSKMDISTTISDKDSTSEDSFFRTIKKISPIAPSFRSRQSYQFRQRSESPKKVQDIDKVNVRPRTTIKKYHIKMEHLKKKKPTSKLKALLSGVLSLTLFIFIYQIANFKCTEEMDTENLRKVLMENLFGQYAAVNHIIETFDNKVSTKIMFLYGGTGVGKTFTTSLILQNVTNSANVYHYTMPSFANTFSPELMLGLTICKSSLIIVDDLTKNDMHITPLVKKIIEKSESLKKNITILLVYNCDTIDKNFVKTCDNLFHLELEDSFSDVKAEKQFIKFEPLTEGHLRKCVEKELGDRKVSEQEMRNILKNFDVTLDGCKGVYTKIRVLNVI